MEIIWSGDESFHNFAIRRKQSTWWRQFNDGNDEMSLLSIYHGPDTAKYTETICCVMLEPIDFP